MKKRSIVVLISLVFSVLLFISSVSAGIYFSDLSSKYNLGDMIDLNVNVDPIKEGLLLQTSLYCNDVRVIDFNNFPDGGNVNIKLPLNFNTIDQANGVCYFTSTYEGETRKSMQFEISKLLVVRLSNDALFANPGEEIIVSGNAEKLNGNMVNGQVEINIPLLKAFKVNEEESSDEEDSVDLEEVDSSEEESSDEADVDNEEDSEDEEIDENIDSEAVYEVGTFYGQVVGGDFSVNILVPGNAPAGDFRIDVLVYEETLNQRSSEGVAYSNLKIFQVLDSIDVALNGQDFDPGTPLEIRPMLLDQSGQNIEEEVSVVVRDENGNRFYEKVVSSNEYVVFDIPTNFISGNYEVEASNNELNIVRNFFVNEKAIASFEIINDSLIVTNVGNIPYNKAIEVELNGKPFVKFVELDFGESARFKLTGSDDEYEVRVSDGNSEITQGGVKLTGRVVDVDAVGDGINFSSPILWIFVFVILFMIVLFLFRDTLKKKSFAFHLTNFNFKKKDHSSEDLGVMHSKKGSSVTSRSVVNSSNEVKKTDAKGKVMHNHADQVLVLNGEKSKVEVLVLKIKNKLGENEKRSLAKAMEGIYSRKGAVYEQGDFIFALFSPLMTKVMNNSVVAASAADYLSSGLNEHNKKFKDKIDFGIAINSGEIINKVENGKLKFTAMGNFIAVAKKMSEKSDMKILMSSEAYKLGGSELKGEKLHGEEVYELRRIVDSEKNNKFIKGFLERQGK